MFFKIAIQHKVVGFELNFFGFVFPLYAYDHSYVKYGQIFLMFDIQMYIVSD